MANPGWNVYVHLIWNLLFSWIVDKQYSQNKRLVRTKESTVNGKKPCNGSTCYPLIVFPHPHHCSHFLSVFMLMDSCFCSDHLLIVCPWLLPLMAFLLSNRFTWSWPLPYPHYAQLLCIYTLSISAPPLLLLRPASKYVHSICASLMSHVSNIQIGLLNLLSLHVLLRVVKWVC